MTPLLYVLLPGTPAPLLAGLVFLVAFLYAIVGFGGASGYLAVMSVFGIEASTAASTALGLNLVVSAISFFNYSRGGHYRPRLLWPFVITSIPAAFIGGSIPIEQGLYQLLLNAVLLFVAVRLLSPNNREHREGPARPPSWPVALPAGLILGLLAGLVGVGGGIFLSPLILFSGWGDAKQAASASAGFIFLNSVSGLAGRVLGGTFQSGQFGLLLIPVGVAGGMVGSYLGARYLSSGLVRRLLALVLLIAVGRYLFGLAA